jgi:hypothetical protein
MVSNSSDEALGGKERLKEAPEVAFFFFFPGPLPPGIQRSKVSSP